MLLPSLRTPQHSTASDADMRLAPDSRGPGAPYSRHRVGSPAGTFMATWPAPPASAIVAVPAGLGSVMVIRLDPAVKSMVPSFPSRRLSTVCVAPPLNSSAQRRAELSWIQTAPGPGRPALMRNSCTRPSVCTSCGRTPESAGVHTRSRTERRHSRRPLRRSSEFACTQTALHFTGYSGPARQRAKWIHHEQNLAGRETQCRPAGFGRASAGQLAAPR
jgi:hypothetical protein